MAGDFNRFKAAVSWLLSGLVALAYIAAVCGLFYELLNLAFG